MMKIVLNGIETNNKGAELMLYAILQEIERKYPDAEVFLPYGATQKDMSYLHTNLRVRNMPLMGLRKAVVKMKIAGILRRVLKVDTSFITEENLVKDAAYFIDASGFSISDQWNPSPARVDRWKYLCRKYGGGRTRMIFLPQAFGPAHLPATRTILQYLSEYATLIMPREEVSENWLLRCGVDKNKIRRHPDFTILVEGVFPVGYERLKGGICIIPNARMIDKGTISEDAYLSVLEHIIIICQESGHTVYLLNHEGPEDAELAKKCAKRVKDTEVVTGLNALEVKGLISTSYLCISSRFHGVISALNSCVPCLSTSWTHKYAELYKDYDLSGHVLDLQDMTGMERRIREAYQLEYNAHIREHLVQQKTRMKENTVAMWREVWG